jgi:hypothetical protein
MRVIWSITGIGLITLMCVWTNPGAFSEPARKRTPNPTQDKDEEPRQPASPRVITIATAELQKAVNGKASVRNRCHTQDKEIEIEETAEVVERDGCKIVLRMKKMTRPNAQIDSGDSQQTLEFVVYADLSNLTTPVLIEKQRFAQCDSSALDVLKVSSRTDPKQPIQIVRHSLTTKDQGSKQTRKDLSLFFSDAKLAKQVADALDRAVRACGGKEWPDEDDLP